MGEMVVRRIDPTLEIRLELPPCGRPATKSRSPGDPATTGASGRMHERCRQGERPDPHEPWLIAVKLVVLQGSGPEPDDRVRAWRDARVIRVGDQPESPEA